MEDFSLKGGTLPSDFEHKFYLEDFFADPEFWRYHQVNKEVYRLFKQTKATVVVESNFWEDLNYFNFLYEQLNVLINHPNRPLEVIEHLKSIEIDDLQLYMLLKSLYQFRSVVYPLTIDKLDYVEINFREERLRQIWLRICIDIIHADFGRLHNVNSGRSAKLVFDFRDIEEISEVNNDPGATINNLMRWVSCYKQQVSCHPDVYSDDGGKFIKQCERKIERLKRLRVESSHSAADMQPQKHISAVVSPLVEESTKKESSLINYGYTQEQVQNYFMQLAKYYSEEQVMCFLKANFEGFAKPGEKIERVKLPTHDDLDKQHIMYMVYCFWKLQKKRQFSKKRAATLLEDNFTCLESFNVGSSDPVEKRTVYKNMDKEPKKGYPFRDSSLC